MTVVLATAGMAAQRALLAGFLRAGASGEPCAVLDAAWPPALIRAARADLRAAGSILQPGDLVLFTSGSSGRPRGVHRTRASWEASLASFTSLTGLTAADRVWLPGPLASTLFLYGAFHAAAVGAGTIVGREDPSGATVVHAVPAQVAGLLARRAAGRCPRLRLLVVAGDRLPDAVRARCEDDGMQVLEYYGAAELSFVGVRAGRGPFAAFPGVEVAIRDGEILSRSPYEARGYLAGAGPLHRDPDGWAGVGDLGRRCGAGFEVLGRGDAAVVIGGHTVVAEEVERALRAVPGVRDAAVTGVPHPRLGQALVALVVGEASEAALREGVRGLPPPARPRRWELVLELPRTAGGKLRRAELAALLRPPRSRSYASGAPSGAGDD